MYAFAYDFLCLYILRYLQFATLFIQGFPEKYRQIPKSREIQEIVVYLREQEYSILVSEIIKGKNIIFLKS